MKYLALLAFLFPSVALACDYVPTPPICGENQTLIDNQCVDHPVDTPPVDTPPVVKHHDSDGSSCEEPRDIQGFRYMAIGGNTRLRWVTQDNMPKVDITVYAMDKTTVVQKFRTNDDGEYTYPGTNHWFRIRGVNPCGLGDFSKLVN